MCGIAGAVGAVDAELVEAVRRADARQSHRGPDAHGFLRDGDVGSGAVLAHRRLAIIDLSPDANQPMRDDATGIAIVYNGEIYNFAELRRALEVEGVAFRSRSDTEVLLRAWVRWGEGCLARLRGMFAFAVWEPRARRLSLVRDRLGIKPLYVARVRRPGGDAVLATRDGATMNALLAPGRWPPAHKLRVVRDGRTLGWAAVMDTSMRDDERFGSLRVGSVVDALADPEDAEAVVGAAFRFLRARGVDLVVSNQSHPAWIAGFEAHGFQAIPDRRVFASSPELAKALEPWDEVRRGLHLTNLDGHGPLAL